MDNNYNDSNKTTIRVKLSDDDYTDIIFDWTKEEKDLNRSIFHQLSSFTGINVEHLCNLRFTGNDLWNYMDNPDNDIQLHSILFDTITKDEFLRDGDCYRLQASVAINTTLERIKVYYSLCPQESINETECNEFFCHVRGTRIFTDRLAKVVNSDSINSYLRAIPDRPSPNIQHDLIDYYDNLAACNRLVIKTTKDLDIGLVLHNFCAAEFMEGFFTVAYPHKPRLYSPNRG